MSVNIDKSAEDVAKTLMGLLRCPTCHGTGIVWHFWADVYHGDIVSETSEKYGVRCSHCDDASGWIRADDHD